MSYVMTRVVTCIYMHMYAHMKVYTGGCVCIYIYIRAHILYTCVCVYVHIDVSYTYISICTHKNSQGPEPLA